MHELTPGRPVANPRRTKLGPEWTAQPTTSGGHPHPTPTPAGDPDAEGRSLS